MFPKVQSLGVCVAALCIWLQPLDVGSVWTARGEVGGTTVDVKLTEAHHFLNKGLPKKTTINKQISGG